MKNWLNNRGSVPVFWLFSIGLASLFLFGTTPVWADHCETDLHIIPKADKMLYQVGDTITFTIIIFNTKGSNVDSPNTNVVIDMSQGLEYKEGRASNGADVIYNKEARKVRSNLGTVEADSTVTVTVVAKATKDGVCTIRANVKGDLSDPNPRNNEDGSSVVIRKPPSTNANGNQNSAGNDKEPVNTFTGGLFNSYPTDLNLRGPMPLFFSRYYDSFIKSDGNITGSLGDNWLHNFDMTLTQNDATVQVITNRGRVIQFQQNGTSWDLTGKTDIAYQLVQSGTDFILGDPYTGRMYTFAQDLPNGGPAPLIIDDFLNPIPRIEALSPDGTFPVGVGTTVEGSVLGGELDALLSLDGAENTADGAYFMVEQGQAIFSQDATSTGRVLMVWDGVDGDAVQIAASTGLGGGVDLTEGGTLDGIEIEVVRNDLPLKVAVLVFAGVESSSELALDIPVTDSPVTFRFPFSELVASRGEGADLTRATTVVVLVGTMGSAVGPVHIEIDSIKVTSSGIEVIPSDSPRKPARIEGGKGNVHTLTYSEETLSSVSDGLGRTLNFTYMNGQLSSVDDGTRTIAFNYAGNDLTSYTDSMGNVTTYTYAPGGLMTAATQPAGNTPYSQTYDGDQRVATQTDALGNTNTFSYSSPDTIMTDPLGNTRTHTHSSNGELTGHQGEDGQSFSMGYDSDGRRNAITDRLGDTTAYTYHAESGKLASVTNADGTTTTYDYTARTHSSGIVFYDLTGITYPDGTTGSFVYDSLGNMVSRTGQAGNVWSFTYNDNGQMLTATNPAGGVATNIYNTDGTLASLTEPAGNTTIFGYDSLKRLNLITRADNTTCVYTYDDNDNLLTVTDERGNTTTFTYDENNNLTTLTDSLGNTTIFAHDGMDRVVSVTDPLGNSATRTYDELERLSTVTDRSGNTTTFGYDIRGRLNSVTDGGGNVWSRTYDAESIIASATNPLSNSTTFGSDNMGRITSSTSPLSSVTSVTYDPMGRMTAVQNPLGQTTTRTYDARGLTSDITLPDGAAAFYARDDLGLITGITDPEGNNWQRAYDSQGRLTSTTDPLGNLTTYQYDNRNRVWLVNLPASTLDLSYDGVGNITRRLYSDGTDLDYTFDAMNRLTGAEGITLGYDTNGRITSSNGLIITRDAGGRIAAITIASGKTITYTYDSRDRLTQVADWLGGTTNFTYDAAGRLTEIARPNGVNTNYSYDGEDRIIGITEGSISSIALTRDSKGQITAANRSVPLEPTLKVSTYTYDSAGRLTSDDTRTYTWDLASRMTSYTEGADTVAFTYDAASQLSTYTYDSMGRRTNDSTRTYTWDLASRMTSYTEDGSTVTFTYDALGHRLSRTEGGATRRYVWNYALGLPCISVTREGSSDMRYYIHTPGGALLYSVEAADNSRRYYHFDEMGNTIFVTDDAGTVIGSYAYTPYGKLTNSTGAMDNPFTWQGQYGVMDEGNGLYYVRARYYDSATARFISRDPIRSIGPQQLNPYQYALGNPLRFVDPSGLADLTFLIAPEEPILQGVIDDPFVEGGSLHQWYLKYRRPNPDLLRFLNEDRRDFDRAGEAVVAAIRDMVEARLEAEEALDARMTLDRTPGDYQYVTDKDPITGEVRHRRVPKRFVRIRLGNDLRDARFRQRFAENRLRAARVRQREAFDRFSRTKLLLDARARARAVEAEAARGRAALRAFADIFTGGLVSGPLTNREAPKGKGK